MPRKPRKPYHLEAARSTSWQLCHGLAIKDEIDSKAYTRKRKHPEEEIIELSDE